MDNGTSFELGDDSRGDEIALFGNVEWGIREFYDRPILTATVDGVLFYEVVGLCRLTEHSNPSMTVRSLTGDEQTITLDISAAQATLNSLSVGRPAVTLGPNPRRLFINREGAYRIVLDSRSLSARELKAWLADDVMPSIEDTGSYVAPASDATILNLDDLGALEKLNVAFGRAIAAAKQERTGRLHAEAKVMELEPKAEQADHHRAADGLKSVGDFANDIKAWAKRTHGVTVKHKQVWDFLAYLKLIIRGNTIRHNHPTAFATDNDYVRLKQSTFSRSSGEGVSASPRLTTDGEGYAWDRITRFIAENGTLEIA